MGLHEWQSARSAGIAGLLILGFAAGTPAAAEVPACFESPGEPVQVAEAIDGDTLRLDDGRVIRLAGIEAPKRPLSVAAETPWPLGEAAREALSDRVGSGRSPCTFSVGIPTVTVGITVASPTARKGPGWSGKWSPAASRAPAIFPANRRAFPSFSPRKKLREKPQSVSGLGRNSPFSVPMILRFGHETAYMNWSRVG